MRRNRREGEEIWREARVDRSVERDDRERRRRVELEEDVSEQEAKH